MKRSDNEADDGKFIKRKVTVGAPDKIIFPCNSYPCLSIYYFICFLDVVSCVQLKHCWVYFMPGEHLHNNNNIRQLSSLTWFTIRFAFYQTHKRKMELHFHDGWMEAFVFLVNKKHNHELLTFCSDFGDALICFNAFKEIFQF